MTVPIVNIKVCVGAKETSIAKCSSKIKKTLAVGLESGLNASWALLVLKATSHGRVSFSTLVLVDFVCHVCCLKGCIQAGLNIYNILVDFTGAGYSLTKTFRYTTQG